MHVCLKDAKDIQKKCSGQFRMLTIRDVSEPKPGHKLLSQAMPIICDRHFYRIVLINY